MTPSRGAHESRESDYFRPYSLVLNSDEASSSIVQKIIRSAGLSVSGSVVTVSSQQKEDDFEKASYQAVPGGLKPDKIKEHATVWAWTDRMDAARRSAQYSAMEARSPEQPCGIDRWEEFIRRAAQALGAFVPEADVRKTFEDEGCPPRQAEMLVIAGRQLAKQQEDDFFKGSQRFSVDQARSIGDLLGVDWNKVSIEQFQTGLGVEMEHADVTGGDPLTTGRIVLAHLKEKPDYYTRLTGAGLERGEKGISFAGEGGSCPTGTCQPFTQLVRDPKKYQACMARAESIGDLDTPKKLYELVREDLEKQDQEVFVVVCLDFRGSVRDYVEVGRGQRHRVAVDVEDIIRPVIASGCDGFCVAHVHPSGIAEPSDADGELTHAIKKAAEVACPNIKFLDHIVVAGGVGRGQWYSFASHDWKTTGKVFS